MEKARCIQDNSILVSKENFENFELILDKWNNEYFSITKLPENLCNPLPYSLYKDCFSKIIKILTTQSKLNFLQGDAYFMKSHILMILSNSLKKRSDEFSVINIHNQEEFAKDQFEFIVQELFSWFYIEIQESSWLKILTNLAIEKYYEKSLSNIFLSYVLNECIVISKNKNKKLIYIHDGINQEFIKNNIILKNFTNQIDNFIFSINPNDNNVISYFKEYKKYNPVF